MQGKLSLVSLQTGTYVVHDAVQSNTHLQGKCACMVLNTYSIVCMKR